MNRYIINAVSSLLIVVALLSCDSIHKFPDENAIDLSLINVTTRIKVSTSDMSIDNLNRSSTDTEENPNMKMIVEVYKYDNTLVPVAREEVLMTEDFILNDEYVAELRLNATRYRIVVWLGYIDQETGDERYYTTTNGLRYVAVKTINEDNNEMESNTDYKDCYTGYTDVNFTEYVGQLGVDIEIPVEIQRPVSKYYLLANDVSKYLLNNSTVVESDLEDYYAHIIYEGFATSGVDCYTSYLNDVITTLNYYTRGLEVITFNGEKMAVLAMEYPFTKSVETDNGSGTTLTATIRIYNGSGTLINEYGSYEMNMTRGNAYVYDADFFTRTVSSGVTIQPNYDGVFNYVIDDDGNVTVTDHNGNSYTF